ncbi:MAG: hypothetical protein AAF790_02795 [Planctomycetota bacterium]
MSYEMVQGALGASFLLVWLFIGLTMLGDRMAEVRGKRAGEARRMPQVPRPHAGVKAGRRIKKRAQTRPV